MRTTLDIATWARKAHFEFFRQFEEPFFGVCIPVDCTRAYTRSRSAGASFFLYYLHRSLAAANTIVPFRYRIHEDNVFIYDAVHASPTINRPDGTFGFAYMDYHADFTAFSAAAQQEIDRVQNSTGLIPAVSGENVIHYSSLPWLDFTSISHARSFSFKDCSPKISFGKMKEENGKKIMPVSIHVHHALMDGYHVGQFADLFQQLMHE
ncbi:chloramphenicol acetyltransferase [Chitinophaga nivalis]|uniref:Chloramphenicol acetyltransferase n=1 Tax=Chitinophaga nivalis TaxID=2991709 RepID=A0ABT3IGR0_9BACT|nr:chloramphenicol acetyltransferase [Chitinophaga nivalis]MCW3467177.1 chloramphenicol acetyltransferase [Chitinophaga nivalis]MCW3483131.1 chloramphenicol acetyltransferase [Chitinophaga nivalis]